MRSSTDATKWGIQFQYMDLIKSALTTVFATEYDHFQIKPST
jgi:hypothetical protein